MENKQRKASIIYWENDGEFIRVRYTQENGERVIAAFQRARWIKPPAGYLTKILNALKRGPRHILGRPTPPPA